MEREASTLRATASAVCRILQKAGFARRVYKILTRKNECLFSVNRNARDPNFTDTQIRMVAKNAVDDICHVHWRAAAGIKR